MNADDTNDISADLKQAQICLDENRHEEAVKMAEAWRAKSPGDVEAIIMLCQGLLRLGRLERLQGLLREVDETIGGLSRVYLRLGELCRISGLSAESANFMNKYNALTAAISPEGNGRLPDATSEVVNDEEVTEDETVDISPEFYTVTLADLYIRQGHLAQAREVLASILAKEPGNEQASTKLTELDNLMTAGGVNVEPERVEADVIPVNAAIISELEGWLARLDRLRSAAA